MTRVDFYLLPTDEPAARLQLVCRLAGKAFASLRRLHIHAATPAECALLDRLLWTHEDASFLPHAITHAADPNYPITLGHTVESLADGMALINLADDVPSQFDCFDQVAEIVDEDPDRKARSRKHYRLYREHGCELQHHQLELTT